LAILVRAGARHRKIAWPGVAPRGGQNAQAQAGITNMAKERTEAFTTTNVPGGPTNIQDAVKVAGLKAFEIPVQETPGLPAIP